MSQHPLPVVRGSCSAALLFGLLLPALGAAQAELTHENLRRIVLTAMESDSLIVERPQFRIDGDELIFEPGSAENPPIDLGGGGVDSRPAPPVLEPRAENAIRERLRSEALRGGRSTETDRAAVVRDHRTSGSRETASDDAPVEREAPAERDDSPERPPIAYPVKAQVRIELLRRHAPPAYLRLAEDDLERADGVVRRMLALAQSGRSEPLLEEGLEYVDEILRLSVRDYAFSNNLRLAERSLGTQRLLRAYRVSIETSPPDGIVSFVPHLDWMVAEALGEEPDWIRVSQPDSVRLLGTIMYRIQWRDGRETEPKLTEIVSDGRVLLR